MNITFQNRDLIFLWLSLLHVGPTPSPNFPFCRHWQADSSCCNSHIRVKHNLFLRIETHGVPLCPPPPPPFHSCHSFFHSCFRVWKLTNSAPLPFTIFLTWPVIHCVQGRPSKPAAKCPPAAAKEGWATRDKEVINRQNLLLHTWPVPTKPLSSAHEPSYRLCYKDNGRNHQYIITDVC